MSSIMVNNDVPATMVENDDSDKGQNEGKPKTDS